jgi:hypothetical protein
VRKRLFRILGQVCAILAITLTFDYILLATVFADWKRSWADAATAYTQAYVRAPWHHDLAPNQNSMRPWGKNLYPFRTDRPDRRLCAGRRRQEQARHLRRRRFIHRSSRGGL